MSSPSIPRYLPKRGKKKPKSIQGFVHEYSQSQTGNNSDVINR